MKKPVLSLMLIFIVATTIYSQDDSKDYTKGNWVVANNFGTATLNAKNLFKINTSIHEGFIGREFFLKNNKSIVSGIEILRLRGNYIANGNPFFLSNNYITIPVDYRFYIGNKGAFNLYGSVGLYGAYLYQQISENTLLDIENKESGLGFNFGAQFNLGFSYRLYDNLVFNLGLKSKSDFAEIYNDSNQEFSINDFYAIQFGIGFNI